MDTKERIGIWETENLAGSENRLLRSFCRWKATRSWNEITGVKAGEIDLIAARGSEVSFVEVKTRRNDHYGRPCEAVGAQKIYHIRRTAVHYLQEQEMFYDNVRFHVVEVTLEQIRDAF